MAVAPTDFEPALRHWITGLSLGAPQRMGAIEMMALVRKDAAGASDLLAHEALATGALEVFEKDGGVVQELLARNKAPRPVVIIEGETLIGARQHRVVAHTVVVGAGTDLVGSPLTWSHLAERAFRSLLPAASDPEVQASKPGACRRSPSDWLRTLGEARIARRAAIGLGEDFEIAAEGLIGSGVWFDGHP